MQSGILLLYKLTDVALWDIFIVCLVLLPRPRYDLISNLPVDIFYAISA